MEMQRNCDLLLKALTDYRFDKETNIEALNKLKSYLNNIKEKSYDNNITIAYEDTRLKSESSYIKKIYKSIINGNNSTYEDMHDIVGTRLICLKISDVYATCNLIKKNKDIEVIEEKDYIKNPKKSGYRSYHMIVKIPVNTSNGIKYVKSEIQLRTIFMDIFAREEHKIRYKGKCTLDDAKKLERLSSTLYYLDWTIDNSFKVDNKISPKKDDKSLVKYQKVFDNLKVFYNDLYNKGNDSINEIINNYNKKDDVLHLTSRIKPVSSIKRKMIRRHLECNTSNMLYKVKDIVGFKIVCTDMATVKDFVKKFSNEIKKIDYYKIEEVDDNLDDAKDSGYRGYRMVIGYKTPLSDETIKFEILIRTMFMDSWALHHDSIYRNEEARKKYAEPFKGLSDLLYDEEKNLSKIKNNNKNNLESDEDNLLKNITYYSEKKKLLKK